MEETGRNINSKATDNKEDDNKKSDNQRPPPTQERARKRTDEKESVKGRSSYNSDS
jgi:hypothetical protein